MGDMNELADTLKSFWRFMLAFALILGGVVGYVSLLGTFEKAKNVQEQVIKTEPIVLPTVRLLKIVTELEGKGMSRIDTGEVLLAADDEPYFEIVGDGFIEVAYSHDALGFKYQPKNFPFPDPMYGKNGARLENTFCVDILSNVDIQLKRTNGDAGKLADEVSREMRDFNKLYKQSVWEIYPQVGEAYEGFWRYVYESYLFIEMYDKEDPTALIASATVKIVSYDGWCLGIGYDDRLKGELLRLGVYHLPEASEGTTLQLISYWQTDE